MDPIYYRKVGRRYVPVPTWQSPFDPAPGIWLISDGSKRRFMRIGDAPTVMVAAAFARHHDLIAATIANAHGRTMSAADLAEEIVLAVATAEDMAKREQP